MKRTGWILAGALGFLACAFGSLAPAQEAARGDNSVTQQKIGFVDVKTVEAGWIEYQVLKRDLDKFFQIDVRDIQQLRKDILDRQDLLEQRKARGAVTAQEYENLRKTLVFQMSKVDIYAEIRSLIVKDKVDRQLDRATRIVEEVINKIGEEEGYDLILNGASLMGALPAMDISQKVINALNSSNLRLTGPSGESIGF